MTPDQLDFITDTLDILKDYNKDDTIEDLWELIEYARETLERAMFIQEDEGGTYHGRNKRFD